MHLANDTLGCLLMLLVGPADMDEGNTVAGPARGIQEEAGKSVELAYVDQGFL